MFAFKKLSNLVNTRTAELDVQSARREGDLWESMLDSNRKPILAGDTLIWTDGNGKHTGTVLADPKFSCGLKVGGRSVKNIIDDADKVQVVKEGTNLQGLGKTLAGKKGTASAEEPVDSELDEPVEEPVPEEPAAVEAPAPTEPTEAPVFKQGDKVTPNSGPHKGEVHTVVKVLANGSLDIVPDVADASSVKYKKGGANAHPEQVALAEGMKFRGLFTKGSLLIDAETTLNETAKPVDQTGKKCNTGDGGTYKETGMEDDMHGVLHCTKCGKEVKRWSKPVAEGNINEGPIDSLKHAVKGLKRSVKGKLSARETQTEYADAALNAQRYKSPEDIDKAAGRFVRVAKVVSPAGFPPGYKAPRTKK